MVSVTSASPLSVPLVSSSTPTLLTVSSGPAAMVVVAVLAGDVTWPDAGDTGAVAELLTALAGT